MKKLLLIISTLLCLLMAGCGDTTKQDAIKYSEAMHVPMLDLLTDFHDTTQKIFAKYGNDVQADKDIAEYVRTGPAEKAKDLIGSIEMYKLENSKLEKLHDLNKDFARRTYEMFKAFTEINVTSLEGQTQWGAKIYNRTATMMNSMLAYGNELSMLTSGKCIYKLTLDNFNKLEKGMPYTEVAKIFSMPGSLEKTLDFTMDETWDLREFYVWEHDGARVVMMFKNGRLEVKHSQKGLK